MLITLYILGIIVFGLFSVYVYRRYKSHLEYRNFERKRMSFKEFLEWYKQDGFCWSLPTYHPVYIPNNQYYWAHTVVNFTKIKYKLAYISFRKTFIDKIRKEHFYKMHDTKWVDEWMKRPIIQKLI